MLKSMLCGKRLSKFFMIRNPNFSKKHPSRSYDNLCLSRVRQNKWDICPWRERFYYRLFLVALTRRIYIMSCALLDCLKRRFCAEFQAGTCNIIYKFAVSRATWKGCSESFSHGADSHDLSKPLPDTKIEREGCFKKMNGFLINFRILISAPSQHAF